MTGPRRSSARVDAAVAAATAATLALLLPFDQTAAAQQAMESVALPRTEQFEQVVQDQLAAAQRNVERLEADADASEAERAAAFGLLGQLYLLYDFPGPAAAALRNAEALEPTDVRWPYYLAELATNEGDHAAAAVALDRALSLQPENLAALLRRGNALFELGRLEDAEKDYRHVLHRVAGQTAALHGLGRIAYERGEHDQAIELLEAALRGQPEGSVIHHQLGQTLLRLGRRDEAAAHLEQNQHRTVVFPDPLRERVDSLNVSSEAHYFRGTAALRRGDARAALDAFLRALEAQPNSARTTFSVGLAHIEIGNRQAAEQRMRQAIALDADYREPHFNLALILAERNDYAAAERHFARAAEIDASDFEAAARRADALTRLGRIAEAVEIAKRVLEQEPAMPVARLTLGATYQAAGQEELARPQLEHVLAAAPGAPQERAEAHYRLALLAQADPPPSDVTPDQGEEALNHLRSAVELDPDLAEARALLGRLLAQRGQYRDAAGHYARAISRDPHNAAWHRDRAMALILGERYAAARGALTSGIAAVERHPADSTSEATVDHLRTLLSRLLSACPDAHVRDGSQALRIARQLMAGGASIEHAETAAMALAETGAFQQAVDLQQQVIAEVERRGATPSTGQAERLEAYLDGQPAREPWFTP